MSDIPPASHFYNRAPDHKEGGPECTYGLQLWLPDVDHGGFATVDLYRGNKKHNTSPFPGVNLSREIRRSEAAYRNLLVGMPELYRYFGVTSSRTKINGVERVTMQFCHPKTLVEKLGALSLVGTPTFFLLSEKGRYSAVDAAHRLLDRGEYSMAADGPYAVHDLVSHALSAQILTPHLGTQVLRTATAEALAQGEAATKRHMENLDGAHSYTVYGRAIADAIVYEGEDCRPRVLQPEAPYRRHIWEAPARTLYADSETSLAKLDELAAHTRAHCAGLQRAAAEMPS